MCGQEVYTSVVWETAAERVIWERKPMGRNSFGRWGFQLSMPMHPLGNLVYSPYVLISQLSKTVGERIGLAYLLQHKCEDYQDPRGGESGGEA